MFDPNTSITICCSICHRPFRSDDGYSICSMACDDELERLQYEEQRERELEQELEDSDEETMAPAV